MIDRFYHDGSLTLLGFLEENPGLANLLNESVTKLEDLFGAGVGIRLDYDRKYDRRYLFVYVETTLPADESRRLMQLFGTSWWFENTPHTENNILFGLDFIDEPQKANQ